MDYSFVRYLKSKVSVDDRALNQGVWEKMKGFLPPQTPDHPLMVIEVGCGIGTMLERMVRKGVFNFVQYTGIDMQPALITHAAQHLQAWSEEAGLQSRERHDGSFLLEDRRRRLKVSFIQATLQDFLCARESHGAWDLLLAHAFLDLVDVPITLPPLLETLRRGGAFYFTLNFDGQTILEPPVDIDLDEQVERFYHLTMDRRIVDGRSSGDSQTGRHLFACLREAGGTILAAGSSDWIVFPGPGGYPEDEAYFLHHIVHTIQNALHESGELNSQHLLEWASLRHAQIDRHELVYLAHQIDFAGIV